MAVSVTSSARGGPRSARSAALSRSAEGSTVHNASATSGVAYRDHRRHDDAVADQPAHRRAVLPAVGLGQHPREDAKHAEIHHGGVPDELAARQPQAPRARAQLVQRERDEEEARRDGQRVVRVREAGGERGLSDAAHGCGLRA